MAFKVDHNKIKSQVSCMSFCLNRERVYKIMLVLSRYPVCPSADRERVEQPGSRYLRLAGGGFRVIEVFGN